MSRQLAEVLLKDKVITQAHHDEAVSAVQSGSARSHIRYLIEKKYIAENRVSYYLSQKFGLPPVNIAKYEISPEVISLVPPDLAKKHQIIPIQSNNKGTLIVAICDPTAIAGIEDVKFRTQMNVEAVLTPWSAFDAAMDKHYSGRAYMGAAIETFKVQSAKEERDQAGSNAGGSALMDLAQVHEINLDTTDKDAPVVTLVNAILSEGIRRMASDIHVEPYEKRFRVRMRVDGVLQEITEVPMNMKRAVIARFKILGRMDIAETRVPQDGRIKLNMSGKEVDFRVSAMPTLFGEKIVLRMLNKGNLQLDLLKLGFESKQLDAFRRGIEAPNGLVLVTGPTGSGKTTTLYSALAELNKITDNLSTAEDPVEYNLEGINQVQVQKEIGLTFASVLRTLLRQDPDTILVGEIRDYETAEVAIQAALTGHLVLSTLHTNDAPSTVTRMINMGIEPFLVTGAVNTIVAQRLLRTICAKCKTETTVPPERLIELGFSPETASKMKLMKGAGCAACMMTGYRGRVAIYEVMDFSTTLKEMVLKGETAIALKRQAVKEGMKTLRMSALSKVAEGRTTIEEALSLTSET